MSHITHRAMLAAAALTWIASSPLFGQTITDIDGNEYGTVRIGAQFWMSENLRTSRYADGTPIPNVTGDSEWIVLTSGAWSHYNHDAANETVYGKLYNFHAVADSRGLCPQGWKVPSDDEWTALSDLLGGESAAGGKLKSTGADDWASPNTGATNESGFTAKPGGMRYLNGTFRYARTNANFWTSSGISTTTAWLRSLYSSNASLYRFDSNRIEGYSVRCIQDQTASTPLELSDLKIDDITDQSAVAMGGVFEEGGSGITRLGVVWGTSEAPSLEDHLGLAEADPSDALSFSLQMTGLSPSTDYHVRAFAVNAASDTAYSETAAFTTKGDLIMSDSEGTVYNAVRIGSQIWMAENLRTGIYADGTAIPNITGDEDWRQLTSGAWAHYRHDDANETPHGKLYNRFAVDDPKGLCPVSWRVPSDEDWTALSDALGGESVAGGKMKAAGFDFWAAPNTDATNESGFTALGSGLRAERGQFAFMDSLATYWSSSDAPSGEGWYRGLGLASSILARSSFTKPHGLSVRCMRDIVPLELLDVFVGSIGSTSATANSGIVRDGESRITRMGVVWGTSEAPSLEDHLGMADADPDMSISFSLQMTDLSPATTYHVRSFAVNAASDTAYSEPAAFTTMGELTYVDWEGTYYNTVRIGSQLWMSENLRTGSYADGSSIPNVIDDTQWSQLTSGAWVYYQLDVDKNVPHGKLYNGYTIEDSRGLCVQGWRVPSDEDWTVLSDALGGASVAGGRMKAAGFDFWAAPNAGATNESGFTALGSGIRFHVGPFAYQDTMTVYWSSTVSANDQPWVWSMAFEVPDLIRNSQAKPFGFSVRCMRDILPLELSDAQVSSIGSTSATARSKVVQDGEFRITRLGVVWGTSEDPTLEAHLGLADVNPSDTAMVLIQMADLSPSTTYHVKAFAVNTASDTVYSAPATFTTLCEQCVRGDVITDIVGNVYNTFRIGDQIWMGENLRTTRFADGTTIPHVTDDVQWQGLATGAWSHYRHDAGIDLPYGKLYNGHSLVDSRGLCPAGWMVPTDEDWKVLVDFLGGDDVAGGKLKAAGFSDWAAPNTGATNESGFTALPGGYRSKDGAFGFVEARALFWTSSVTQSGSLWFQSLSFDNAAVERFETERNNGLAVRCLRASSGVSTEEWPGGTDGPTLLPERFELRANYPNPFNPSTMLSFALPEASTVRLEVFDAVGRRIALLADGPKAAGVHMVAFQSESLSSGVYIARFTVPGFVQARSMILVR